MSEIILLGASNAVPTPESDSTHFVVSTLGHTILVDCATNPLIRIQKAGLGAHAITDVILTHFHPDHVGGLPLMLMDMWLLGRTQPLNIYGLDYTLERAEKMMALFAWDKWPQLFPVNFIRVPDDEMSLMMDAPDLRVLSSPVRHLLPTIGLRFEFKPQHKTLAYSCDTSPCPQVVALAAGADVLLHEASGPFNGHSTAAQAARAAQQAKAKALYLIHYPPENALAGEMEAEAKKEFSGPVTIARDFMRIRFE